jgi:putative methyltransferase (TIGR01177 family)
VIELWVELSQENLPLARLELDSAVDALGGRTLSDGISASVVSVGLPNDADANALADRIALARRVLRRWPETGPEEIAVRLGRVIRAGERVSFRRIDRPTSSATDGVVAEWARSVRAAGARIDLETPDRQFRYAPSGPARWQFGEQVAVVDRTALDERRMPHLPYRRPVSLAPKLGRVAANLARIRPGDRVVDPFLGTGALALECALLGARVTGIDRDATMARGALANFAHLGVVAESIVVADSGAVVPEGPFDALVTDPPYGRASPTGGEEAGRLARRVVGHWSTAVRPSGRIVVVVPGGDDPVGAPWVRVASIPDRVHGSLTREFRVYAQPGGAPPPPA